jgi:hypothetical protein
MRSAATVVAITVPDVVSVITSPLALAELSQVFSVFSCKAYADPA